MRKNVNTDVYWNNRYAALNVRKVLGGQHRKMYELVADMIFKAKHNNIIDIGCGIGPVPYLLQKRKFNFDNRRYFGIDFSDVCLKRIKQEFLPSFEHHTSRVDVLIRETDELKYETFDISVCIEVIEHLRDYRVALLNCRKFIHSGGISIVSFPIEPIRIVSHVRTHTPISEIETALLAVGLKPFSVNTVSKWCIIKSKVLTGDCSDMDIKQKDKVKIKLLSDLEIK